MSAHYIKISVPEWFCSTVCAGLNVDDLLQGDSDIESPEDNSSAGSRYTINAGGSEENKHLNEGRL